MVHARARSQWHYLQSWNENNFRGAYKIPVNATRPFWADANIENENAEGKGKEKEKGESDGQAKRPAREVATISPRKFSVVEALKVPGIFLLLFAASSKETRCCLVS